MYRIDILGNVQDRTCFDCGDEALNIYIKQHAKQDFRRNVGVTYVLTEQTDEKRIIGYYTLSQYFLEIEDYKKQDRKKLPRYDEMPATLVGRLAVDREFQGHKIGKLLIYDALATSLKLSSQIASTAVVVDAKGESAVGFYKKHGFRATETKPMRLYMPMGEIGLRLG